MPGTSCERALPPCQKLPSPGTEIVKIYSSNSSSGRLALCYYNIIFILQFIMCFFVTQALKIWAKLPFFLFLADSAMWKNIFTWKKQRRNSILRKLCSGEVNQVFCQNIHHWDEVDFYVGVETPLNVSTLTLSSCCVGEGEPAGRCSAVSLLLF